MKKNLAISNERKYYILECINTYKLQGTELQADFENLFSVYEKWFKIFPFEITYFSGLKEHFKNQFPIIKDTPFKNQYSGITKFKLHTKSSLLDYLLQLTHDI